jgi:hypothetical protein
MLFTLIAQHVPGATGSTQRLLRFWKKTKVKARPGADESLLASIKRSLYCYR